jgi:cephalosporin hydroxylase
MKDPSIRETVNDFAVRYFEEGNQTWHNTYWLGTRVLKLPLDLWVYQELLVRERPDVIVESGTFTGGSALYLASICDLIGTGRVITIDIEAWDGAQPQHDRITYVRGSSTDPEVIAGVRASIDPEESVMVILDSEHQRDHVLAELRGWSPAVTPGQYLIVEDTMINGNPVEPGWGPGPKEAVEAFLAETDDFEVDTYMEKFLFTWHPGGYLRRRSREK